MAFTLTRHETLDSDNLQQHLRGEPRQVARTVLTAARAGVVNAQVLLGQILLDGTGIERDPALARLWFGIAAKGGDAMAHNMLGRCLEHGWGGAIDLPAAARHYRLAMADGLDWALYNYAGLLAAGRGVAADQAQAFALYQRAADMGHAKSMNLVGRYLEEGLVGPADSTAAAEWYKRSAEAGDFRGQFSYAAVLAARGAMEQALVWIERALLAGNLNFLRVSRSSLALAADSRLHALALQYHERAAELGDASDEQALAAYRLAAAL